MMKREEAPLRTEVSPAIIAVVIGVLVLVVGGFFLFQNMRGPKFLTGGSGKATGQAAIDQRMHTDKDTGLPTTKD